MLEFVLLCNFLIFYASCLHNQEERSSENTDADTAKLFSDDLLLFSEFNIPSPRDEFNFMSVMTSAYYNRNSSKWLLTVTFETVGKSISSGLIM